MKTFRELNENSGRRAIAKAARAAVEQTLDAIDNELMDHLNSQGYDTMDDSAEFEAQFYKFLIRDLKRK